MPRFPCGGRRLVKFFFFVLRTNMQSHARSCRVHDVHHFSDLSASDFAQTGMQVYLKGLNKAGKNLQTPLLRIGFVCLLKKKK